MDVGRPTYCSSVWGRVRHEMSSRSSGRSRRPRNWPTSRVAVLSTAIQAMRPSRPMGNGIDGGHSQRDMKGRIIGRRPQYPGFEKATGVDVIVDETPRHGRRQRVQSVRRGGPPVDGLVIQDGRFTVLHRRTAPRPETTSTPSPPTRQRRGGRNQRQRSFQQDYQPPRRPGHRTSYGQNVLRHSVEVAFSRVMADELV